MSQKPETLFRKRVARDLMTLPSITLFPIQQKTIRGDPDYLICLRGHFVALELKSEHGRATKLQEHKLEHVRSSGGIAFVVFPENWPSIFQQLKSLETRNL